MKISEFKVGDMVVADAGFTCLDPGEHRIEEDHVGLYIRCQCGHHYLDGQVNGSGHIIGISPKAA